MNKTETQRDDAYKEKPSVDTERTMPTKKNKASVDREREDREQCPPTKHASGEGEREREGGRREGGNRVAQIAHRRRKKDRQGGLPSAVEHDLLHGFLHAGKNSGTRRRPPGDGAAAGVPVRRIAI